MQLTHVEHVSSNYAVCVFNDGRVFEVRGTAADVSSRVARIAAGEIPFPSLNGPTVNHRPMHVEEPPITPTMTFDPPASKRGLYPSQQETAVVNNKPTSGEETAWETEWNW
jgi:hypothetical protein